MSQVDFCTNQITCLVTLFDRKVLVQKLLKLTIFGIFYELLARFARHVE